MDIQSFYMTILTTSPPKDYKLQKGTDHNKKQPKADYYKEKTVNTSIKTYNKWQNKKNKLSYKISSKCLKIMEENTLS